MPLLGGATLAVVDVDLDLQLGKNYGEKNMIWVLQSVALFWFGLRVVEIL
jgi:hypothetical protein